MKTVIAEVLGYGTDDRYSTDTLIVKINCDGHTETTGVFSNRVDKQYLYDFLVKFYGTNDVQISDPNHVCDMEPNGTLTYKIRFGKKTKKSNKILLQVFIKRTGIFTNDQLVAMGEDDKLLGLFGQHYRNTIVLNKWLDCSSSCMVNGHEIIDFIKHESGLKYEELNYSGYDKFIELDEKIIRNNMSKAKPALYNVIPCLNKIRYAVEYCK